VDCWQTCVKKGQCLITQNTLRDNKSKFGVHRVAEWKEMNAANKARTAEVKPLEREKKEIGAWNSWKCSKQFWKLGRKL
jgi:hypothetical protein